MPTETTKPQFSFKLGMVYDLKDMDQPEAELIVSGPYDVGRISLTLAEVVELSNALDTLLARWPGSSHELIESGMRVVPGGCDMFFIQKDEQTRLVVQFDAKSDGLTMDQRVALASDLATYYGIELLTAEELSAAQRDAQEEAAFTTREQGPPLTWRSYYGGSPRFA